MESVGADVVNRICSVNFKLGIRDREPWLRFIIYAIYTIDRSHGVHRTSRRLYRVSGKIDKSGRSVHKKLIYTTVKKSNGASRRQYTVDLQRECEINWCLAPVLEWSRPPMHVINNRRFFWVDKEHFRILVDCNAVAGEVITSCGLANIVIKVYVPTRRGLTQDRVHGVRLSPRVLKISDCCPCKCIVSSERGPLANVGVSCCERKLELIGATSAGVTTDEVHVPHGVSESYIGACECICIDRHGVAIRTDEWIVLTGVDFERTDPSTAHQSASVRIHQWILRIRVP